MLRLLTAAAMFTAVGGSSAMAMKQACIDVFGQVVANGQMLKKRRATNVRPDGGAKNT